jgi:hypothetical protein
MNTTDREKRAAIFESLLLEHDKLSREVSLIQSKFDLTNEDNKKINELKRHMEELQRKAYNLGSY